MLKSYGGQDPIACFSQSAYLIDPVKALSVLNRHLKLIPEFVERFIGRQVQAIEAERTERNWLGSTVLWFLVTTGTLLRVWGTFRHCHQVLTGSGLP